MPESCASAETRRPPSAEVTLLAVCLLAIPILAWWAPVGPVWHAATGPAALVILGVACAGALVHLRIVLRGRPGLSIADRRLLLGSALASHGLLWPLPPLFSNDLYRYLFDGRLSAAGLSPFAYAPANPKVTDVSAGLLPAINHPEMVTIYPPVAQGLFLVAALLGGTVLLWKAFGLVALGGAAALLDRGTERPLGVLLLSHPLVLIAVASHGHVDVFGLLAMVAAMAAWRARRPVLSGLAIAAAAGLKIFPLGLPMALTPRFGIARALAGVLVVGVLLGLSYFPLVLRASAPPIGSLGEYAARWEYNAGAWRGLRAVACGAMALGGAPEVIRVPRERIPAPLRPAPRPVHGALDDAVSLSRAQLAWWLARSASLLVLVGTLLACVRSRLSAAATARWLLLMLFLTSPTVHPWYLLWLLPWALRDRCVPSLVFCATGVAGFGGPALEAAGWGWRDPAAMAFAVHGPVWLTLLWTAVRAAGIPRCLRDRGCRSPSRRGS
ncbi:MAG: DUF2029 domain-containing protein [Deltaproteobacteria bacterium]|nr:MAG: DUF2029 domain-containing protein [Deltaproteobacteria bacterium]